MLRGPIVWPIALWCTFRAVISAHIWSSVAKGVREEGRRAGTGSVRRSRASVHVFASPVRLVPVLGTMFYIILRAMFLFAYMHYLLNMLGSSAPRIEEWQTRDRAGGREKTRPFILVTRPPSPPPLSLSVCERSLETRSLLFISHQPRLIVFLFIRFVCSLVSFQVARVCVCVRASH